MSNNYQAQASIYAAEAKEAAIRAGPVLVGLVAAGWIAFPFAVQTVLHPGDAILLQYKIQGLWVPRVFTAQQQTVGFIEAVLALAALVMFQLVGTTLFYRRVDGASVATPALWPLACGLACLGNAAWFLGTGAFDVGGCLVGLSSAALTVGGEMLCEKLGREFVMGVPAQPWHSPPLLGSPAQSGQAPLLYPESGQAPVHYYIPD